MQIKPNNLLDILPKILLSVRRKFPFWLVTLRLNTTFKIWSSISSPWYMGLWWSWAEFPTGVNSTAGFFFSSICLHIFFWDILGKISKKSWQTTSIFITQEIKLSKHFFLISNQDKYSKYLLGLFPHSRKCPVLFLKMPIVWSWLSEELWSFVIKSHKKILVSCPTSPFDRLASRCKVGSLRRPHLILLEGTFTCTCPFC